MADRKLLEEHSGIMENVSRSYVSPLIDGINPSIAVLDLAINDLDTLVTKAENIQVKAGFEKSKIVLTYLRNLSSDDLPHEDSFTNEREYFLHPIIRGLRILNALMLIDCGSYGMRIAKSEYVGGNPCREHQYLAVEALGTIRSRLLTTELPETVRPLSDAINSYLEQCKTCPYRALERKKVYKPSVP